MPLVGGIQGGLTALADLFDPAVVDVGRCVERQAGVPMLSVIPGEKVTSEGPCVLDGTETTGKFRPIFQGLNMTALYLLKNSVEIDR